MDSSIKIAFIRDIFIIVNSAVFIIILIVIGLLVLKVYKQLYPSLLKTSKHLEESSNILLNLVSQPVNLVAPVLETVNRVWALVENLKNREWRKGDEE
tara:strand:- start:781 stop:1074 length:294 start_codon:yes stop_codon:yes gene_type:complete